MNVQIYRAAGSAVSLHVDAPQGELSVKSIFSAPGSGEVLGDASKTLAEVAIAKFGSVANLGTIRVNGVRATLDTMCPDQGTIMIFPKVEGGVVA